MAKFCGRCGSRIDEATGLCPNCDAEEMSRQTQKSTDKETETKNQFDSLHRQNGYVTEKKSEKTSSGTRRQKEQKRGRKKTRRLGCTFALLLLFSAIAITSALNYLGYLDVPFVTTVMETMGLKQESRINRFVKEYAKQYRVVSENDEETIIAVSAPDFLNILKAEFESGREVSAEEIIGLVDKYPSLKKDYTFTVENNYNRETIQEAFLQQVSYELMISAITEINIQDIGGIVE